MGQIVRIEGELLSLVIDELTEERGIAKDQVISIVVECVKMIFEKKYPGQFFFVEYSKKNNSIDVFIEKKIVKKVSDGASEISLRKAHAIDESVKEGQQIKIFTEEKLGRIEILQVKNLIGSKIAEFEAQAIYKEFSDKKGNLVSGVISKLEPHGFIVDVQGFTAFLPNSLKIPGEILSIRSHIRALIKEIHELPRLEGQIILDRSSVDFVKKLLELDIPEIFGGIIHIDNIVRVAGYKTKILVSSRDNNINPVGTCIGVKGSRIQPILKEIGIEKLDVIANTSRIEDLVINSLKPAKIESVNVSGKHAYVIVAPDERSVAVGKGGKNVGLASELIDIDIEIAGARQRENNHDDFNDENSGDSKFE